MKWRTTRDRLTGFFMRTTAFFAIGLTFLIALCLLLRSWPILSEKSLGHLLLSTSWYPLKGEFGFLPFIMGTLLVTAIAMVISVPVCLLSAIYLSEYAHRRLREAARHVIDIMAAIPSVVYGLWGVILVVPFVRAIGQGMGYQTTGYTLLAGGIILAIMASPIIISVSIEVFQALSIGLRETALALGTTKWEMIKHVVLRSARRGILSAIILGLARAFGETMAVLMVVGNVGKIPRSIFDPAYPLPALIANNYGEMMSIPRYDAALLLAALLLLLVVGGFNLIAHLMIMRMERA